MKQWHESLAANIGLRAIGIVLLGIGWWVVVRLHQITLATPARDNSTFMMMLAAIVFLCASAGSALLFVGSGLWESVEVSERWLPPPPGFEESSVFEDMQGARPFL